MVDMSNTTNDRAEAAVLLRKLLDIIEAGEVTGSAGQVRRIEGAVIALEATAATAVKRGSSN